MYDGSAVVVCIGTTKVTGDSLGPLVGERLLRAGIDAYVYGTGEAQVNGKTYGGYAEYLARHHGASLVIAVDACVGKGADVGKIRLSDNGVLAGGALGKKLGRIGDIGLLGIVAEACGDNLAALSSVSKEFVSGMADRMAEKVLKIVGMWNRRIRKCV